MVVNLNMNKRKDVQTNYLPAANPLHFNFPICLGIPS